MSSPVESASVLQSVLRRVTESPEFRRLASEVAEGARVVSVAGLTSASARALALAALRRETGRRFAVVVAANRDMEAWERDLSFWCGALGVGADDECEPVLSLPASEGDPYAGASPHAETLERRALALWRLAHGRGQFALLSARALVRRTVAPSSLLQAGAQLRRDEDYPPEDLVELLLASGYVREDPVGAVGEFSMRGGILDVWSPGEGAPVRVEFFGDTVDSIRRFDPETQLSIEQLQTTELVPMRELTVGRDDFRLWAEFARDRWSDESHARALKDRTVYADEGETFAGWEWLIPLVLKTDASAFEYRRDTVLVLDEPAGVEQYVAASYETVEARYVENDAAGDIGLRPEELYLTVEELRARIDAASRVELRALGRAAAITDERFAGEAEQPAARIGRARRSAPQPLFLFPAVERAPEVEWRSLPSKRYHGRVPDLAADVRHAARERSALTLFSMPSLGVAERVADMLGDYNVSARVALAGEGGANVEDFPAVVTVGKLSGGFEFPGAHLVVHVETDLFDEATSTTVEQRVPGAGVGTTASARRRKSKTAAKRAMRDMADELLKLYAERKLVQGYVFSADSPWQREFEEAFEYVPTPDQDTAIEDVKRDMEQATPMDRLLCGDVGYGKTEIAMRAAFKAVMDSKQAAVLAPTTVLAYQHYETFRSRFAAFPVTIELISRFRSPKEQKEIVKRVESGEIDIIIGTHRLLSKDIAFRDLGLVVVDEEQRFGVAHKERLKQLKKRVDVLTLSATPIPRTLNMSLMGLRDM